MTVGIQCFVVIQDLFKMKSSDYSKSSDLQHQIKECEEYCMSYLSARETAKKWGVNVSLVKRYCTQGRVPGVVLQNGVWRIPEDAIRPTRTDLEYTSEQEFPELAKKLQNQKKKRNFHGLYDFTVIDLTYSSSRMASVRLTRQQVETIFKKGKVRESFEPMKVSDVIEVLNHIHCVDYILS